MTSREVLEQVREGALSVEEAERFFQEKPYEDLGYARLDLHRQTRSGFPEAVYCEGKQTEQLVGIFQTLYERNGAVLGTRAAPEQAEAVEAALPGAVYDPVSRILRAETAEYTELRQERRRRGESAGRVAVVSGGTADQPVAEEAALTAEFLGADVDRIYDVGVCGLHRLLSQLERIRAAQVIIAVAGMEGALASVVAGLVENPVLAVPTSVGYGSSLGGLSALLSMLNSCANGVAAVNIDNGYGAGYLAAQIGRLSASAPSGDRP